MVRIGLYVAQRENCKFKDMSLDPSVVRKIPAYVYLATDVIILVHLRASLLKWHEESASISPRFAAIAKLASVHIQSNWQNTVEVGNNHIFQLHRVTLAPRATHAHLHVPVPCDLPD